MRLFLKSLKKKEKIDLAFIDGNHRRDATLDYFLSLLKKSTNTSIFIFDDIHWSSEMEEAWKQIQEHDSVTLTVDFFFIGIVFFNPDFKVKQHFTNKVLIFQYLRCLFYTMIIGVLKEPLPETRVSILPEHIALLKKLNVDVLIEIECRRQCICFRSKICRSRCKSRFKRRCFKDFRYNFIYKYLHLKVILRSIQNKILLGNYQPLYHANVMQTLAEKKVTRSVLI